MKQRLLNIQKKPVDPHIVNEDEFKAALAFTDDQYLQAEGLGEESGVTNYQLDECSPNVFHYVAEIHMVQPVKQDINNENYVYKIDDNTYKKITRNDKTTPWTGIN